LFIAQSDHRREERCAEWTERKTGMWAADKRRLGMQVG
jgi:hypothetical protein